MPLYIDLDACPATSSSERRRKPLPTTDQQSNNYSNTKFPRSHTARKGDHSCNPGMAQAPCIELLTRQSNQEVLVTRFAHLFEKERMSSKCFTNQRPQRKLFSKLEDGANSQIKFQGQRFYGGP